MSYSLHVRLSWKVFLCGAIICCSLSIMNKMNHVRFNFCNWLFAFIVNQQPNKKILSAKIETFCGKWLRPNQWHHGHKHGNIFVNWINAWLILLSASASFLLVEKHVYSFLLSPQAWFGCRICCHLILDCRGCWEGVGGHYAHTVAA